MKRISKKVAKRLVQNHNRRVREANKKFMALKPAERRIAIARDVLAQLASKRLIARNRVWLSGKDNRGLFENEEVKKDPELQEILNKKTQCEGCALGGLFMCAVQRSDALKLSQLSSVVEAKNDTYYEEEDPNMDDLDRQVWAEDAFSYLGKFFAKNQLELIEAAFEKGSGFVGSETSNMKADASALAFAPEVHDAEDRMRLIMENIIVNKGKFVPTKQPVSRWVTPGFVG